MKSKNIILTVLFLVVFAVLIEVVARFNLAMNYVATSQEVGKYREDFDAELGWIAGPHDEIGARPRPVRYGNPLLAVFGDSMVYGREVGDSETWESRLADLTKRDVFNFGQRSFGADQAYMRYLRMAEDVHAPYFAIGMNLRGINRLVNVYHKFYRPDSGMPMTKPRFQIEGGELRRVPNPLASAGEMDKLMQAEFIASLGQVDPWFRGHKTQWLASMMPESWSRGRALQDTDLNLWNDQPARQLMARILSQFAADVRAQGAEPLILILPIRDDIKAALNGNRQGISQMLEICENEKLRCYDGIQALKDAANGAESNPDLWMRGRLLSPHGHDVIAKSLAKFLGLI